MRQYFQTHLGGQHYPDNKIRKELLEKKLQANKLMNTDVKILNKIRVH